MKMTTEEAFIKVLQMHGIEHAFGIIGSAMMPISDLLSWAAPAPKSAGGKKPMVDPAPTEGRTPSWVMDTRIVGEN